MCLQSAAQGLHLHRSTDATGAYVFDDLPAGGSYVVTAMAQSGWVQTFPAATNRLKIQRGSWRGLESGYNDVCSWDDFAFLAASGIDILDVSQPCYPQHILNWKPTGSCGIFEDVEVSNGVGFFASGINCGVIIADLRPLPSAAPQELSRINAATFPGVGSGTVTSIWVDGSLLFLADGQRDEVFIFDISAPANPKHVITIEVPSLQPVEDVFVRMPYLFATNAVDNANGGIDILDIETSPRRRS